MCLGFVLLYHDSIPPSQFRVPVRRSSGGFEILLTCMSNFFTIERQFHYRICQLVRVFAGFFGELLQTRVSGVNCPFIIHYYLNLLFIFNQCIKLSFPSSSVVRGEILMRTIPISFLVCDDLGISSL